MESDQNDQQVSKERCFYRMLEIYYNSNISNLSNALKKCIPDIDVQNQNKYVKKNDKLWMEANLHKIYQNASQKLQKQALSKNNFIKTSIENYLKQFQTIRPELKTQITQQHAKYIKKSQKSINDKQKRTLSFKNNKRILNYTLQNIISQPSNNCDITIQRNSLTSKRTFRVRQFRKNLDEIINNTRYIQKLQRVKLQSTFTQFFFHKDSNPQKQWKEFQNQPKILNKLKAMTNIRGSFHNSQSFFNSSLHNLNQKNQLQKNQRTNNTLGFQLRKQNIYKPKSKCRQRKAKIFLNQ